MTNIVNSTCLLYTSCASSSESNYGKRKTVLDGMYLILTEKERYCMNLYMYSEDDENAQNRCV